MFEYPTQIIKDPTGQNWYVRVYHDEGIRCLYTTKTDEEGPDMIVIKSFDGYFKIKISSEGQIITYPMDSIG